MYRDMAMAEFRRHYFHGLRNNQDSAQAATDARWKTKDVVWPLIQADKRYATDLEREEAWADALSTMLSFQNLLMFVPIDKDKIGPNRPPVSSDLSDHVEGLPEIPGNESLNPQS